MGKRLKFETVQFICSLVPGVLKKMTLYIIIDLQLVIFLQLEINILQIQGAPEFGVQGMFQVSEEAHAFCFVEG